MQFVNSILPSFQVYYSSKGGKKLFFFHGGWTFIIKKLSSLILFYFFPLSIFLSFCTHPSPLFLTKSVSLGFCLGHIKAPWITLGLGFARMTVTMISCSCLWWVSFFNRIYGGLWVFMAMGGGRLPWLWFMCFFLFD